MSNKDLFVSLFITVVLFFVTIVATAPAFADSEDVNVRAGIIVEVNTEEDYCIVEDACGLFWEFYEVEDFMVGDLVIMSMWNAGTSETILDDEILDVVYSGFVAADIK